MKDKEKIITAVREILWISLVWNDHNFTADTVFEKARKITANLGVKNVEEANQFIEELERRLLE